MNAGSPPERRRDGVDVAPGRPPDLRLAGFAIATWLSALAGLFLSAVIGLAAGAASLLTAIAIARWRHRATGEEHPASAITGKSARHAARGSAWWIGVAVLLGAACGATATAARVSVKESEPLNALIRDASTVRVDLVVRDDPRAVRGSSVLPPTYVV